MEVDVRKVETSRLSINVATAGEGRPLLLLHGFPHTWRLWATTMSVLARDRRVIAPDSRGLGDSERSADGYDAENLARDIVALLDHLLVPSVDVVAIDAGVPPAFLFALHNQDRIGRLVVMESLLGQLAGAETFLSSGAPWWFGFHQVPGLAERVVVGHEAEYLDFFYRSGTFDGQGIDHGIRDDFVNAYSGIESLRCGFEYYRAMPSSAAQIATATSATRLATPTLVIGSEPVGDALFEQVTGVADNVIGDRIAECGHLIPLDRPAELIRRLASFLA
ncbi:alpha/beta fold hydrolase [Gordonia sp. DT218]|uniref:alpha/beta fold hydrolase n=1 Tax=Gordonia sp. DT218 TaxID=3416659 RepID=UPI003CE6901A